MLFMQTPAARANLKQILGIVCDNASNNDTLMTNLEFDLGEHVGPLTRIRCFAHIINLVVKVR